MLHFSCCTWHFRPHPDPLPWGEGTAAVHLVVSQCHWANSDKILIERQRTILPLPKGEGRGEGNMGAARPTGQ